MNGDCTPILPDKFDQFWTIFTYSKKITKNTIENSGSTLYTQSALNNVVITVLNLKIVQDYAII